MKTIILPLPPSLNNIFGNKPKFLRGIKKGGRFKTQAYKAWLTAAGWTLKADGAWYVAGPVRVSVRLPEKMRGDIDNRVKPLLDILVAHKRIDDDKNVKQLSVSKCWGDAKTCRIEIEAITA